MYVRSPLASLVLLVLSLPLAAQGENPITPSATWEQAPLTKFNTIDWPAGFAGDGPFRRIVAGNFTGQETTSCIALYGKTPVLVYQPAIYAGLHVLEAAWVVDDIACLPALEQGREDYLVAVGPEGLVRVTFDGTRFDREAIGSASWQHCSRLVTADIDSRPGHEIAGLTQDRTSVLIGGWDAITGVWTEDVVPLNTPAVDFVFMDWFFTGLMNLVTHCQDGLNVYALEGEHELVDHVRLFQFGGAISVLDGGETGPDRLVWVTRAPNGLSDWLFVFDATQYEGPLSLRVAPPESTEPVDLKLFAIQPGDVDADGDQDLLIAHEAFMQAIVLENDAPTVPETFGVSTGAFAKYDLSLQPEATATGNRGVPVMADLDDDPFAAADFLVPVDNTSGLIYRQGEVARVDIGPIPPIEFHDWTQDPPGPLVYPWGDGSGGSIGADGPGPVWEYFADLSFFADEGSENDDQSILRISLRDIPANLLAYGNLQVLIWNQPDPNVPGNGNASYTADSNTVEKLAEESSGDVPPHHRFDVILKHDELDLRNGMHCYVVLRFASVASYDDPPVVTDASYGLVIGLTMAANQLEWETLKTDGPAYAYLMARVVGQPIILDVFPEGPRGDAFLGTGHVGAIIPQGFVPPFDPGAMPDPADVNFGPGTVIWLPQSE